MGAVYAGSDTPIDSLYTQAGDGVNGVAGAVSAQDLLCIKGRSFAMHPRCAVEFSVASGECALNDELQLAQHGVPLSDAQLQEAKRVLVACLPFGTRTVLLDEPLQHKLYPRYNRNHFK